MNPLQVMALYESTTPPSGPAVTSGALPVTTAVQIALGGSLDLAGASQTIASLSDGSGGGGTVTNSIANSVTLTLAPTGGSPTSFSGAIQDGSGQVSLELNGTGRQVLTGPNTYTGVTAATAGTLQIGDGTNGTLGNTSAFLTGAGGVLAFSLSGTATISQPITGFGSLVQMGPGVLVITGTDNRYTGGTTVDAGTLTVTTGGPNNGNTFSYSNVGLGLVTVNPGATLIGQSGALGVGYNTSAAPLFINGGVVIADAAAGPVPGASDKMNTCRVGG